MKSARKILTLFATTMTLAASSFNVSAQDISVSQEEMVVEYYAIPSPDEILSYIHNNEIGYTRSLLTDPTKSNLYQTSTDRLLSFGFYMADMAYSASFEQSGTALRYFEVTETIGKNINLFPPEIQNIGERLMNNMNRMDSINEIYDELYLLVIANLHDTDRFGEYALISAGGFIESMYLALNSNGSKIKEDEFGMRVWDQKMILDQLNNMFNKYLNETQKKQLLGDFEGLNAAFSEYSTSEASERTSEKRSDGAVVIGSNSTEPSTSNPIDKIHKEVNKLRDKWVKK
ncbi:hypothetical protein [Geofilum rubicundum]|nr:hypothetical protein [Geofilum rubicundum]